MWEFSLDEGSFEQEKFKTHHFELIFNSDEDECLTADLYCSNNTRCVNLPGSYHCAYQDGYLKEKDRDEYLPNSGCSKFHITLFYDRI